MLSHLAVTALLGLTATAAPWGGDWKHHMSGHEWHGGHGKSDGNSGPQVPFKFPLSNGFPNVKMGSPELMAIEKQAHGTLPNGALPTKIEDTTATNFQLIAFNEIFEVAYFSSLLNNITSGEYEIQEPAKTIIERAITAVIGQEQLHALGANGILQSAGRETIQPCEYVFPVSDPVSAIELAYTFTDVVLGTLAGAQQAFGMDGDTELISLIGAVIGQEGEQNGFYRSVTNHIPSALPFLTASAGPFAFSALQMFVVPGSCPNIDAIDVPIFPPLTVNTMDIQPKDQTLSFSFKPNGTMSDMGDMHLVYINQQNTPVVESVMNVQTKDGMTTFQAALPYEKYLMNGLTIAAVTSSAGPFASAMEVAEKTMYGPGLIEIQ